MVDEICALRKPASDCNSANVAGVIYYRTEDISNGYAKRQVLLPTRVSNLIAHTGWPVVYLPLSELRSS
jgi:hypothetical protein